MYIFDNSNTSKALIAVCYENVCQYEDSTNYGVSHLLEHMVTENYKNIEVIYDERCIENNAFTSSHEVVFYISGLSSEINKVKEDFVRRIVEYVPLEEHFNKQKSIIVQEIKDVFSDPSSNLMYNAITKQYNVVLSAGYSKVIENITFDQVKDFYDKYYNVSKIIEVNDVPTESFKEIDYKKNLKMPFNPSKLLVPRNTTVSDESIWLLIQSDRLQETEDFYYAPFLLRMFNLGLSSPLYQEVREKKGLAYWISSELLELDNFTHSIQLFTSTSEDKLQEVIDTIMEVLNNPEKYLTEERFNLVKNNRILSKQLKEIINANCFEQFLDSSRESINLPKNIENITYEKAIEFYNTYLHPSVCKYQIHDEKHYLNENILEENRSYV